MSEKMIRHINELMESEANKSKKWVIWGAAPLGLRLLQQARAYGLSNVYIYDSCYSKVADLKEKISMEGMKNQAEGTLFIITAIRQKSIDEIYELILAEIGGNSADIYRFVLGDYYYINEKLRERGFDNGEEIRRALTDLQAKQLMERKIEEQKPFFFSRWGNVEGNVVYADRTGLYIDEDLFRLKNNAGVYPLDELSVRNYIYEATNAAKNIDILCAGGWVPNVEELYRWYSPHAVLVSSEMMNPFLNGLAWTRALRGKKVLVIHPFAKLIEQQYEKRDKLFTSPDVLPEMDLMTYPAIQSMNGNSDFPSWSDALNKMKKDIKKLDFDVALLGCGAYGMPLGSFIKCELGRQAVHMGGTVQILFGIKGKRWETGGYDYQYRFYNEYWVRPTEDLKPENYKNVEDGCYW